MKIWHISDTHTFHGLLNVPDDIDMVIFSGDCSNPREVVQSTQEIENFIYWYSQLPIRHKIFVAGNHDTAIARGRITAADFAVNDIEYLENDFVEIEGFKIYGSPYTPTFGNWSFMKARDKMHDLWAYIPDDIDIMICHGPIKGVLDLSRNTNGDLEYCGDLALKKRILAIEPKLFCSGHIHNYDNITNAGYTKLQNYRTIFSNGSVVADGRFGMVVGHGNILEIN